jgi:hypothetical protein
VAESENKRSSDPNVRDSIVIRGHVIPVLHQEISEADLRFYPENPRVHSVLRVGEDLPTQEEIQELLCSTDHVKSLFQDIKRDGGLTEPIVVRAGTMEVLEGNSRLAAYRLLAAKDPAKWRLMRCMVLPADMSEDLVFALLGQYHLKGKLGWAPFEQAGFLYRRYKVHDNDLATVAKEIGFSQGKAEHLVETYGFMTRHDDIAPPHWSHYDEYFKSRDITRARKRHEKLDDVFVNCVKNDDEFYAIDVRTKLAKICKHDKVLKKFVNGDLTLDEAYQQLVDSGAEARAYQKLKRFGMWITTEGAEKEIRHCNGAEKARVLLELRRLSARLTKLYQGLNRSKTS